MSNKLYIIQLLFLILSLSAHYSLGGKRKRLEKRSARNQLVKPVFFFTIQNNQLSI